MNIDLSNIISVRTALKKFFWETMTVDLLVNWAGLIFAQGLISRTAILTTRYIHITFRFTVMCNLRGAFSSFFTEMHFDALSWDRGEFLFQRLDVREQDGPSSSSGFQHLTLQTQGANMNIYFDD